MRGNLFVEAAQQALLYEAVCWPKPGLVDPVDVGSHPDMTVFHFLDSSVALMPYLETFFDYGEKQHLMVPFMRLKEIRSVGIEAEKAMFEATDQINTHKGAIFSLGIFLNSLGALTATDKKVTFKELQQDIREMVEEILVDFEQIEDKANDTLSYGEYLFKEYGLLGIRGQAYHGYPEIFDYALPFYLKHKGSTNEKLVDTLLYLALHLEDTTLIKRSKDVTIQTKVRPLIMHYFELGASHTTAGKIYLDELNDLFKQKNWSLGGCADMLVLVVFLAKLIERNLISF